MKYIWKQFFAALLSVALAFALLPATALAEGGFGGAESGDGSSDTPYLISTKEQLEAFRNYINDGKGSGEYFQLTKDIDLGGEGSQWTPIGNESNAFKGTFDGGGHTISGLYINDPNSDNQGLFGVSDGKISSLRVEGSVTGKDKVGGIVGYNYLGSIINCSSGVTVKGESNVGGITGNNTWAVKNCYNNGDVTGSDNVGGIVGNNSGGKDLVTENCYNTGTITCSASGSGNCGGVVGRNGSAMDRDSAGKVKNCYNIGKVNGGKNSGGVVGINCQEYSDRDGTNIDGVVEDCYYLTGTAQKSIGDGQTGSGSAPPKSAAEFKALASTLGGGWEDSPFLCRPMLTDNREVPSVKGKGTEDEPYEIPDLATLEAFRDYINAGSGNGNGKGQYFKLMADIDMSDKYGEGKKSWTPIGDSYTSTDAGIIFQGTFDGDNHEITGLYINKPNESEGYYQGLFGQVGFSRDNQGVIKNLTVSGTVTGYEDVGGIAGVVYVGTIENCVSNVKVEAKNRTVGGIAGYNQGTINACINNGTVSAGQYAGGIAGTNDGTVLNCYNTANISCTSRGAGGIVGNCAESGVSGGGTISGTIKNCYSTGHVSGPAPIGGIVGSCKKTCVIKNCHWVYYPNTNTATMGSGQCSFTSAQIASEREGAGFTNGKVAYLLSKGEGAEDVHWGQKIGENPYPVFNGEQVYCVTFATEKRPADYRYGPFATGYANSGGTVTLPAAPTLSGMSFDHWSTTKDKNGETFDSNTIITGDITVYAVGQKTFGGDNAITHDLHEGYGTALTVDLDQYMAYQSEKDATGKFNYTLAPGADGTNASLSGSTLTVPTGLKPGTYEIAVTAEEKQPDFALMSVESYGVDHVTLTVRVVVSSHIWKLTSTDEATGDKTYTCDVCQAKNVVEGGKYCVSGRILKSDGKTPSAGTPVDLRRGGETLAQSVTDSQGRCSFPGVEPGIYNLVVGEGDNTTTVLVEVTGDTPLDNITELPENVSSKLAVTGDETPAVVVGGLDKEAQARAEADKAVTVTMTVEAVTDGAAGNAPDLQNSIDAIKTESTSSEHEYLDLTIEKTVSEAGQEDKKEEITETKNLITVVIPFDPSGKSGIVVYRYHSGSVDTLTRDKNGDGEYFDVSDSAVTVHAKNFSTYAIGYTVQTAPTSYAITVPQAEHGTVTADRRSATRGRAVTLTATPDEGCHLASLTVTDRRGKPVELTDNGDGTYTFTQPSGRVTVAAEFVPCSTLGYSDLDAGAWYHDCTDYVITNALMRGVADGKFDPDGAVTRAQMVTVLWNMRDKPVVNYYMTYSDVSEDAWYAEAVRWAASEGIAGGYGNGLFGPNDPITREQMAVMLYRYEQKFGSGGFTGQWSYRLPFTDLDQISDWAFEAVAWCSMKGVVLGRDNAVFDPSGPAKRAELAAILTRYCDEDDIK